MYIYVHSTLRRDFVSLHFVIYLLQEIPSAFMVKSLRDWWASSSAALIVHPILRYKDCYQLYGMEILCRVEDDELSAFLAARTTWIFHITLTPQSV